MSFVMIDKENASEQFIHVASTSSSSNTRKFGDSIKIIGGCSLQQPQLLFTPQNKLKSKMSIKDGITNTDKRRALGDLMNTTRHTAHKFNGTPKANLSAKFGKNIKTNKILLFNLIVKTIHLTLLKNKRFKLAFYLRYILKI